MRRRFLKAVAALAAVGSVGAGLPAWAADDYPTKPVTIVVTFPAGGTTDSTARIFAEALTQKFGQQFLVENIGGANGSIGTANVKSAEPDGYRLLIGGPGTLYVNPKVYDNAGYTYKDFDPAAQLAIMDFVVVARKSLGVSSIEELIAYSKANPGKLNFGSAGIGNTAHQAGELFKLRTGADLTHIPYTGGALAVKALLAGEVDAVFNTTTEVLPIIRSGDAVPLAVMSRERIATLPDVPTLSETGVANSEIGAWNGLYAPHGTPQAIIDKLNAAVVEFMATDKAKESLAKLGLAPGKGTPAEILSQFESEIPQWDQVIALTNKPS
ncbi:MAG TPA: tripartite tricarboxylate transporter substrate binding protein [Geminicoccaceae bacterium]|nr:tripartite tricarboxylate transporter substrate binding protein [Geminicoccus sp.]HMU51843.1 tripartite tricarboxylate transporter substrate binding protein [Geminicoccaceae bacterium]